MSDATPAEQKAPPPGERIHMPGPSILPLLNSAGLAIVIVGVTLSIALVIGGALLFGVTTVIWIRSVVREVNDLPLEHH